MSYRRRSVSFTPMPDPTGHADPASGASVVEARTRSLRSLLAVLEWLPDEVLGPRVTVNGPAYLAMALPAV